MKLTAETIEKLRSANMANLVKKLQSGKTLTAAESKLIEAASATAHDKELVTTGRLAEIFGINRKTLGEWRRIKRDDIPAKIDEKEDLVAWRAWFAANPDAGYADKKPRADREALLCEKLTIEIAIKSIELEEAIGKVVEAAEVEEHMAAIGAVMKSMLQRVANDMPPVIEGLGAASIKIELEKQHDIILKTFAGEAERVIDKRNAAGIHQDVPPVHKAQSVGMGGKKRANPKQRAGRNVRRPSNAVAHGAA